MWHLFCKHLAENTKLPPTAGSLEQHTERVHVQARVWSQAMVMCSICWTHSNMVIIRMTVTMPTTMKVPPAPQAILESIKCQCETHCTTQRCSCQKQLGLHTAQTSDCVELTVKMMQTVMPNMTLRTVMKIYRNILSK